jgi:hypothetical protein
VADGAARQPLLPPGHAGGEERRGGGRLREGGKIEGMDNNVDHGEWGDDNIGRENDNYNNAIYNVYRWDANFYATLDAGGVVL